tara:strand:+ start:174 stop:1100 length:927 start_codon:yes stop_codon:yes gene_type:complete
MNKKKYIIVRIFGGMGNQLWQYAFARSLSIKFKKKLILDISFFKNSLIDFPKGDKFKFELNQFNLNKEILIEKNIYNYSYKFYKYFLRFLPKYFFSFFFKNQKKYEIENLVFEEKTFEQKLFKELSKKDFKTSYFLGYWQNTKYFKNCFKLLKEELKPKIIKKNVFNFITKIKRKDVAIHIRGGDMFVEKKYSHPTSEYYFKIIKFLEKKNNSLNYHIFTDDIKYAEIFLKKIKLKNYKIISKIHNFSAIEEFYIMQHYKNFVINRSTFSWWSSYLSHKNKTTIFAPKIWQTNLKLPISLRSSNMKLF